ncbi:ABC transporter ATP-binding protein [Roseobacter sp.]|uniref:ABC transporter ATP-binding protein n=1 Tax=Roseobacter sp. TaxID=1907202 RepID=UPI00329915AF
MTDTVLSTKDLSAGYGQSAIIRDLTLDIPKGQFTALLGPNGCGKSTLLRTLAGLHMPLSGSVTLNNRPLGAFGAKERARQIAILAQNAQAPDGLTVHDLVSQGRYPHRSLLGGWRAEDTAQVDAALDLTQMTALRDHPLDHLSGGQQQRAWIAMTLAQQGQVLLLDEPTSFLDLSHQIEVLDLVRGLIDVKGVSVVAVLHDLNQAARYADHLVLLKDGAVQALGPPTHVLTPDRVAEVFGVKVRVIQDPETDTPLCIPKRFQTGPSH